MRLAPIALAVILGSSIMGCQDPHSGQRSHPQEQSARTVIVKLEDVKPSITVLGQLKGSKVVGIKAKTSGSVIDKFFKDGDFVKKGQPLYQLESDSLELALHQATEQRISAQIQSELADSEHARIKGLFKAKAISKQALDSAQAESQKGQAQLKAATALENLAKKNLSDASINAPFSGFTGKSQVFTGDIVTTQSEALVFLTKTNPLWVEFGVSHNQYTKMLNSKIDKTANVELEDGTKLVASLIFESQNIDTSLGTVALRAQLSNADYELKPGQFVSITLSGQPQAGVARIPQSAVMLGPDGHFVYVLSEGKAETKQIEATQWEAGDWHVTGLNEGDVLITSNHLKIRAGAPVIDLSAPSKEGEAER